MNTRFLPAGHFIQYTIEQKKTVPMEIWRKFTSSVINIYYSLPFCLRPVNPRKNERTGAYDLFEPEDILVFCGASQALRDRRIIAISRERTRDVLSVDEIIADHEMSVDLFTRMVMLALHNVCGEHFIVHSTAGACSWALPLLFLKNHVYAYHFKNWKAPDVARYSSDFTKDNARLMEKTIITNLSMSPGIDLSLEQWKSIATMEFKLYESSLEATQVDITLGTSAAGKFRHHLVLLRKVDALLHWSSLNIPEYKDGVPDQEPVFLSPTNLAQLSDDVQNGWFSSSDNSPAELQLLALWAEHCIRTLDFEHESAFLFASW
ncbi:TPA: hypothetical protein KIA93_000295 [Salmonella enterica]|uniref:hypothetical protein n=1 Tax=Salmonella enterica TaxID=28901 RepID=UPI0009B19FCF|nr:hypothetical protein [Salmonella enterica]HBD1844089.1 hypothetical protein [Salmonella enterica]